MAKGFDATSAFAMVGTRYEFQLDDWLRFTSAGIPQGIRVHFTQAPSGRWVIDEVHVAAERVTARFLRVLPLGGIEAEVNRLVSQGLIALGGPEPKFSDAVQFRDDATGTSGWVRRPKGMDRKGDKGDGFYREFAEVYGKAAVASTRPAADLAKTWKVPTTTVHRWTREARRRGHLPPAEQGRRG